MKGEQGLPGARPRRCTIQEQVSGLSLAWEGVGKRAELGVEAPPPGWGRPEVGQGVVREGGRAPVQGYGEVQEGGHQLGGVVPGQQGDGLQSIVLGLGDADRAELQVDGLAQVGNLRRRGCGGGGRSEGGQARPGEPTGAGALPW